MALLRTAVVAAADLLPLAGGLPPGGSITLVPDSAPTLVAEASSLLYYPLLQHTFFGTSSSSPMPAAILLRAQTSPDVDVPCSDATFVSYDAGRSWRASTPETGTGKYGPHVQKRACFPFPLSPGRGTPTDSALCLPYARDAARDTHGAALTADFAGTLWRFNATAGELAPVEGQIDALPVKFSDPFMALGSRRYTDGNGAVRMADGSGWLLPLYATDGIHRQTMPLAIHIYNSTDMLHWQFRARVGRDFLASENSMVRLGDSRLMLVFRSELPQKLLFQTFSSDEGLSWTTPATLSGVGPGGTPHSCEPKLVRLADVGALVLSSGRPGQFIWYANEKAVALGGGRVPIEAAEWQSFDVQAHHDAAFKVSHPEYCFQTASGGQVGWYTGYSSLSAVGDRLVVAYDRMPAGQPHGSPPNHGARDRIFSLGFRIARGSAPPPPTPGPQPPGPNATCQAQADAWCTRNCLEKIAGHTPSCGHGGMVARCSGADDSPGSAPRWRCYGVSTLSTDRRRYVNGSCFCSMTAGIDAVFKECGQPSVAQCSETPPPPPPASVQFVVPFVPSSQYSCFRIPSLLALPNGRRLLFAEGRKTGCLDGPFRDHIDIVMKISNDGGRTWGELRKVHGEPAAAGQRKPIWITNAAPILLRDTQHLGHVVLVVSKNNRNVLVLRSTTGGESFGPPIDVSATAVLKPWKCVQIELGVLLLV